MSSGDWIAIVSVVVTGIGVIVALAGVRDQLRMATFLAYTDRYTTLMARMPFEARQPGSGYDLQSVSSEERHRVLSIFRDYFNLCSEELWLADAGKIDKKTWKIWKLGIEEVAAFPSFAAAWRELRGEYVVYTDFRKFMDEMSSVGVEGSAESDLVAPTASGSSTTAGASTLPHRRASANE
jgi:hypothetical protein